MVAAVEFKAWLLQTLPSAVQPVDHSAQNALLRAAWRVRSESTMVLGNGDMHDAFRMDGLRRASKIISADLTRAWIAFCDALDDLSPLAAAHSAPPFAFLDLTFQGALDAMTAFEAATFTLMRLLVHAADYGSSSGNESWGQIDERSERRPSSARAK